MSMGPKLALGAAWIAALVLSGVFCVGVVAGAAWMAAYFGWKG